MIGKTRIPIPKVYLAPIVIAGGWDQTTPTLNLKPGVTKYCLNFECAPSGGYTRIAGYERYDGHPSPADSYTGSVYLSVASYTNTPTVGNTLTSSSGASGTIAYIDGLIMVVCKITGGTFAVTNTVSVGATTIGVVNSVTAGPTTPVQQSIAKNAVADIYRDDISAVPGTGAIRGIVYYNNVVYAFRDNTDSTACDIYKSSATGWTQVKYYKTVSFTSL